MIIKKKKIVKQTKNKKNIWTIRVLDYQYFASKIVNLMILITSVHSGQSRDFQSSPRHSRMQSRIAFVHKVFLWTYFALTCLQLLEHQIRALGGEYFTAIRRGRIIKGGGYAGMWQSRSVQSASSIGRAWSRARIPLCMKSTSKAYFVPAVHIDDREIL